MYVIQKNRDEKNIRPRKSVSLANEIVYYRLKNT